MNISDNKKILEDFLIHEKLGKDTIMYRHTLPDYLNRSEMTLKPNEAATEMVEDIYGTGHLIMDKYVGRGLAFTLEKDTDYQMTRSAFLLNWAYFSNKGVEYTLIDPVMRASPIS